MSWDVKYRPLTYTDVISQDATVDILKHIVASGKGFQQSYLFAGCHGGGKTTLGRILARALLCDDSRGGEPCDACYNCLAMLRGSSVECFTEVDAATNSGKESIRKILDESDFSTLSGKRRVYLLDESHQLSRDALDALLKPIEDVIPGTEDRRLVVIFCTTEPEKMRATIGSRCGPTFTIRVASPADIATRLARICESEGVQYDPDALTMIAEGSDGHIRDAVKALEMLSLRGRVSSDDVLVYLGHHLNDSYLRVLSGIGRGDVSGALTSVREVLASCSPGTVYEKLAKASMVSYKVGSCLESPPPYWSQPLIVEVFSLLGRTLLELAKTFSTRPKRASRDTLECDVASACVPLAPRLAFTSPAPKVPVVTAVPDPAPVLPGIVDVSPSVDQRTPVSEIPPPAAVSKTVTLDGQWIDPRGMSEKRRKAVGLIADQSPVTPSPSSLSVPVFERLVLESLRSLEGTSVRGFGLDEANQVGSKGVEDIGEQQEADRYTTI